MNNERKVFSRREMLEMTLGIGGLVALGSSVFAQEAERLATPSVELGPFYPILRPKDLDADLTIIKGHKKRAEGDIIYVSGQVLNQHGEPVKDAKVEIWQANKFGRYAHPSDTNDAPLDENFQGFAVLRTDSQGRYHFKTIKPGPYGRRTRHIHFDVMGKENRLTTQMFFPDEPLNDKDLIFSELRSRYEILKRPAGAADVLIAKQIPPPKEIEAGAMSFVWDIVLLNG